MLEEVEFNSFIVMRVLRLMRELESLYEQCGDVEVRVVSDDYCLSIHSIADVRKNKGYDDRKIEIVIG